MNQFFANICRFILIGIQRYISINALPLDIVRVADDRGFGHLGMRDERAFDFGCAHTVARDIDDIVNAAGDPIITIFIAPSAIASEIFARIGREICLEKAFMIPPYTAHLPRPAIGDAQITLGGPF